MIIIYALYNKNICWLSTNWTHISTKW